ncbi:DNA cytosine methyltransferase [Catellatospora sp. IY07-71]|uniref:DNA cytosine methyltransferase n=1 Tax=Catellatospora sp. IY07-71 TaxID=2728827 RepID=UPI001FD314B0|nr:DNA cytosine methyltransferase [Catellatospora sp. IY07-71]
MPKPPLQVVDLFAGCGGLSQGFRQSGFFTPVAAVEFDSAAAATYAANFGADHIYCGDIKDWVNGVLPDADVVVGGPPCQGFSNLGKKDEDDERNQLWRRYVDALVKIKPRAFLMENVDRFGKSREFQDLYAETAPGGRLEDYHIEVALVRATDFGSAQLRKRVIVIGTRRDLPAVIPIPEASTPKHMWRTVKDALTGVPPTVPTDRVELPGRTLADGTPGWFTAEELHITRRYDPELSIPRFHAIPPGGNRFDLPDHLKAACWKKHETGSGDVMGRLRWEQPSVTIRTEFFKPEKGRYLHPVEHRAITHYEAARLQGFPDDFKWCGNKIQIARQIGNAVPVELAQALAEHIGACLTGLPSAHAPRSPRVEQPALFAHVPTPAGAANPTR